MIYIFGGAFDPPHIGHASIIRAILHYKKPDKIVIIPSSQRDDKTYHVSDEHRLKMLELFVEELRDERVILDDFFVKNWHGEMITRDVDQYAREKYGPDLVHIFGVDTIESMPNWDAENYASQKIAKIFIPREDFEKNLDENFLQKIKNFEIFSESHFPKISSTEIRAKIPEYTHVSRLYADNLKKFLIPGLSHTISLYILENRLYRDHLPKERVLVHVCCGPDVVMPILQLKDEYELICFWYDPNIQPKSEYDKRFEAFKKVCDLKKIPFIKWAYDVKNFFDRIRGFEYTPEKTGEKCTRCYDMRMYVAAKLAKRLGIKYFTTSLNTSPKKDLDKMFFMWHKHAEQFGIEFLDIPFRKRGGFALSAEYTKEHDIYRQNYCGCIYSIREGGDSELKQRMVG